MDGEIRPDELAALLGVDGGGDSADGNGQSDIRIVDIRDERAFDRGHVPHSECVPFPELTTRVAELEGAERIVTVCPHGVASRQAAQLIGSYAGTRNARVESLHGGIEAWEREIGDLDATPTGASSTDASGGGDANRDSGTSNRDSGTSNSDSGTSNRDSGSPDGDTPNPNVSEGPDAPF